MHPLSELIFRVSYPEFGFDEFLDHFDYVINMVGIDYVSLGLDYYTAQWPYREDSAAIANYNALIEKGVWSAENYPKPPHKYPETIETPNKMQNLISGLFDRKYSIEQVIKIANQNLIRVFQNVWKS